VTPDRWELDSLPVAQKGFRPMHPADRLALAVSAFFITAVLAGTVVVWRVFEARWVNAVFAIVAALAFFSVGWLTHRWSMLGEPQEGP
jgi:hypothetical protein